MYFIIRIAIRILVFWNILIISFIRNSW